MNRLLLVVAGALFLTLGLVACGDDDDDDATPPDNGMYDLSQQPDNAAAMFVSPADGDVISGPVSVEMAAEGVEIVPADVPAVGEAHFHIMVNIPCLATGEFIPGPSDEATEQGYRHFGTGATTAELELEPGTYELCLQLADGVHAAFGATDTIAITVE